VEKEPSAENGTAEACIVEQRYLSTVVEFLALVVGFGSGVFAKFVGVGWCLCPMVLCCGRSLVGKRMIVLMSCCVLGLRHEAVYRMYPLGWLISKSIDDKGDTSGTHSCIVACFTDLVCSMFK
jgi:hypothetical protein